ncbi:hypothetical protein NONI108955_08905 [Nocardia ninae]|uniref:Scaffolding protein n=1 Tax=Nocardia ninae NBRC 108245 TaxID=1210091 RepID=A0A511MLQ6_9NOCA|nr:hypothetical protein [Nocardia ninae]GEM40856.1 hypothetical protein NN4_53750 [Nocardia ninae NBRC 108245]
MSTENPAQDNSVQDQGASPQNTNQADVPDWVKKELADVRAEAARYRIEKNDALNTALTAAQAAVAEQLNTANAEKQAAADQAAAASIDLLRLRTALAAGVPGERAEQFASLLQGSTAEELQAHAETVKTLLGSPVSASATDPTQGMGGASVESAADVFGAILRNNIR